jgi:hypothetical protein
MLDLFHTKIDCAFNNPTTRNHPPDLIDLRDSFCGDSYGNWCLHSNPTFLLVMRFPYIIRNFQARFEGIAQFANNEVCIS